MSTYASIARRANVDGGRCAWRGVSACDMGGGCVSARRTRWVEVQHRMTWVDDGDCPSGPPLGWWPLVHRDGVTDLQGVVCSGHIAKARATFVQSNPSPSLVVVVVCFTSRCIGSLRGVTRDGTPYASNVWRHVAAESRVVFEIRCQQYTPLFGVRKRPDRRHNRSVLHGHTPASQVRQRVS
jgi:hypothetical protein